MRDVQSVIEFTPRDGINSSHRKEGNAFYSYSLIDLDAGAERAVMRLYYSKSGARNYACLWIMAPNHYSRGSGWAGGYGYHRPSAAAQEAFTAAGVKLAQDIAGRGDDEIRDAMRALAPVLGIARPMVLKAHG